LIKSRLTLIGVLVTAIVILIVGACRIIAVNQAYPVHNAIGFDAGEEAFFDKEDFLNNHLNYGDIGITVKSSFLRNFSDAAYLTGHYQDELLLSGEAKESMILFVNISVSNYGKELVEIPLYEIEAQSGSWHNGLVEDLFSGVNEGMTPLLVLQANEQKECTLPFTLFSTQFNSDDEWASVPNRSFELVLAVYPNKYYIKLENSCID
jgi:hypothetical protein